MLLSCIFRLTVCMLGNDIFMLSMNPVVYTLNSKQWCPKVIVLCQVSGGGVVRKSLYTVLITRYLAAFSHLPKAP